MTLRKSYLFPAVVFATLAMLTVVQLAVTKAEVKGSNAAASQEPEAAPKPKSIIGASGVMAFVIMEIRPGSAAEQAGLRPADLVTALDGQINSIQDFQGKVTNSEPGTSFSITYRRFNPSSGAMEEHKGTVQTKAFRASGVSAKLPEGWR
ncbi:MAG: Serine protease HhoB [Acidobacteria bacterium]|nr:Serine protease HhoB [Acidobacteriota bacterium]